MRVSGSRLLGVTTRFAINNDAAPIALAASRTAPPTMPADTRMAVTKGNETARLEVFMQVSF